MLRGKYTRATCCTDKSTDCYENGILQHALLPQTNDAGLRPCVLPCIAWVRKTCAMRFPVALSFKPAAALSVHLGP